MTALRHFLTIVISVVLTGLLASSCNKDEELIATPKPIIQFDNNVAVFQVRVGEELVIAPLVTNGTGAEYLWTLDDGTVVCRDAVYRSRWSEPGEYYVTLTVTNDGGSASEEIRIDVIAAGAPTISLPIPTTGLRVPVGAQLQLEAIVGNVESGDQVDIQWTLNGNRLSSSTTALAQFPSEGTYSLQVTAATKYGSATFEATIVATSQPEIGFVPLSYMTASNERYTIVGRPVSLSAVAKNICGSRAIDGSQLQWSVNGQAVDCHASTFDFVPTAAGTYTVAVTDGHSMNSMTVVCLTAPSTPPTDSGADVEIIEYIPAPGQFIGEKSGADAMPADATTHEAALRWANGRLAQNSFVSLGAWGGYVIVRFKNGVNRHSSGSDFEIMGNAITTSNEPGIVWVMQDVNGNGLPDDEWYQLRGSDFDATTQCYGATYYRPAAVASPVQWLDCNFASGTIDYMTGVHTQPSYYPAWIESQYYTLWGASLPPRNVQDPVTGEWNNRPFDWGYADNLGSDLVAGGDTTSGNGQWAGFSLGNAATITGTPVSLERIDFVKIQTGVMAKSGRLGELSTEICGLRAK